MATPISIKTAPSTAPAVHAPVDAAAVKADMQAYADKALAQLEGRILAANAERHAELLNSFKAEVAAVQRPGQAIMAVEINGTVNALTNRAAYYLGDLLINAQLGLHSYVYGPAGCGKTTAAYQVAEARGQKFFAINLTEGASESWLLGRWTPAGDFIESPFLLAYEMGYVFLADEFDAAHPNLLLVINTALEAGEFTNPINGRTYKKHEQFVFIAAGNTSGRGADALYTGRNRMDAATLNRFAASTLAVEYDLELERELCPDERLYTKLQAVRAKLRSMRTTEFIGTRHFKNAFKLLSAGLPWPMIATRISAGWPAELVTSTEINSSL